jgi:hypothetical protein
MQYFKGDVTELKVYNSASTIFDNISRSLNECFDGIYNAVTLGQFLFDEQRMPLTNAIKREVFITCFKQIFEAWSFCGTFESYILVFKKIFGEDATIEFTVPAAGKLQINIDVEGVQTSNFQSRDIVDDDYVFSNIVDDVGDKILFRTPLGIASQFELETILFSMVPSGIFTEVSLTIGA